MRRELHILIKLHLFMKLHNRLFTISISKPSRPRRRRHGQIFTSGDTLQHHIRSINSMPVHHANIIRPRSNIWPNWTFLSTATGRVTHIIKNKLRLFFCRAKISPATTTRQGSIVRAQVGLSMLKKLFTRGWLSRSKEISLKFSERKRRLNTNLKQ